MNVMSSVEHCDLCHVISDDKNVHDWFDMMAQQLTGISNIIDVRALSLHLSHFSLKIPFQGVLRRLAFVVKVLYRKWRI